MNRAAIISAFRRIARSAAPVFPLNTWTGEGYSATLFTLSDVTACLRSGLLCVTTPSADLLRRGITTAHGRPVFHSNLPPQSQQRVRVHVSFSSVIYSFVWVNVPFGAGVEPLKALQAARNRYTHYYCAVCLVVAAFWSVYPDVSLVLNTLPNTALVFKLKANHIICVLSTFHILLAQEWGWGINQKQLSRIYFYLLVFENVATDDVLVAVPS